MDLIRHLAESPKHRLCNPFLQSTISTEQQTLRAACKHKAVCINVHSSPAISTNFWKQNLAHGTMSLLIKILIYCIHTICWSTLKGRWTAKDKKQTDATPMKYHLASGANGYVAVNTLVYKVMGLVKNGKILLQVRASLRGRQPVKDTSSTAITPCGETVRVAKKNICTWNCSPMRTVP